MPFTATVLTVMIASPGDVTAERDVVEKVVYDWNRNGNAQARGVVLLPLRWEMDSSPVMYAGGAQQVINNQLVAQADVVLALFHTRLGTATERHPSGTVEELEEARARGISVRVWVSTAPMPHNVPIAQLQALRDFRDSRLKKEGLLGEFTNHEDLRSQVRFALDRDVFEIQMKAIASPTATANVAGTAVGAPSPDGPIAETDEVGVALPPKELEGTEEVLWPVPYLRRLITDGYVSTKRVTRLMDELTSEVDTYHSTSQLAESLGYTKNELRGAMSGLSRYVRARFPDLRGHWPFHWEWGPAIEDSAVSYPSETHYFVSAAQAKLWTEARSQS